MADATKLLEVLKEERIRLIDCLGMGDYVPNLDEIERNKRLEANKYSKPKDDFKKNYAELIETKAT